MGLQSGVMVSSRRISRVCSKAQVSGEEARRASAQAGTPQFIIGASFGEAAFASMFKGKAYIIFL